MVMNGELLKFATQETKKDALQSDDVETPDGVKASPWHILVVDDDQGIHDVTKLILSNFRFENRPLKLTYAYSAREAQGLLDKDNNFAVLLLDVVMETDHAGLDLVNYIRNVIKNQFLRIVLRTGQPGQAPELSVIADYDINDYREKSELTSNKMMSCLTAALRSYRDIQTIHELMNARERLQEQVIRYNSELQEINSKLKEEISERSVIELELEGTTKKLTSIINNSQTLICLKDVNGKYDLVNEAFQNTLAFTDTEVLGKTDSQIFPVETARMIECHDNQVLQTGESMQCEEALLTHDREHIYLCVKFPLFNKLGEIHSICSICTDITERLTAQNEIIHLAQYDPLTDLPNRALFIDRMTQELTRIKRHQHYIAVLFIDLDRFKNINDTLGHDVGDKLLVEVSHRLNSILRAEDSVCRLGGDEFAVLLTGLTTEHDIIQIVDKIMASLSSDYLIDDRELMVTPSIGISRCPQDGNTVEVLMKKADIAMYKSKNGGRNRYSFYLEEDNLRSNEMLSLEVDLRKMSARNYDELFLLYQPKINISNGQFSGVEALIRWQHPKRGLIFPADFIPLLEEIGLIVEVGEWVLREACCFAVRCANAGKPFKVAVNLSARQFKHNNLVPLLQNILMETGCAPKWLELEVTEGSLIDDFDRTKELLDNIFSMGIHLAIDDFGTGYSSLNYLKNLPFTTLKIDRSFIVDAPEITQDKAIVTTIAQLAHNLNMSVVAEGVETPQQYHLVKTAMETNEGNQIQGFIFAKPLTEVQIMLASDGIIHTWNEVEKS